MKALYKEKITEHIARYCGPEPASYLIEDHLGVGVVKFISVPTEGFVTYLTAGLFNHVLKQARSGTDIRQELLICVKETNSLLLWEDILLSVASIVLKDHKALMCGQVIGPMGMLFTEHLDLELTSLLCSYPPFFDEEFCEITGMDISTIFVELIPITTAEAEFIRNHGSDKFFEKIDSCEVDILDLRRK